MWYQKNDTFIDFKAQLNKIIETNDLRATNKILGMKIHKDITCRNIWLSQKSYIENILQCFYIHNAKPISTPLRTRFELSS